MRRSRTLASLLLLLLPLASCGDDPMATEDGVAEEELTIIPVSAYAPPLDATRVRLVATKGQTSEVLIRYRYADGTYGKCLLFRVPANALLRRPDGTLIQPGESVEITISVVDPKRFLFEFEPSGLRFDPASPAELEISHKYADRDYNLDGVVDGTDAAIFAGMRIWRQERLGAKWTEIPTVRLGEFEAVARIDGFTRYALAAD